MSLDFLRLWSKPAISNSQERAKVGAHLLSGIMGTAYVSCDRPCRASTKHDVAVPFFAGASVLLSFLGKSEMETIF